MNRIIKTLSLACICGLALSCSFSQKSAKESEAVPQEEPRALVDCQAAQRQEVPQEQTYPTTVQASVSNNVVPQSGTRIKRIRVEIGDFVSRGQILAEMDNASLQQASLKLANDSTELVRLRGLFEAGAISRSDFETAEMGFKVSRTSYENLLENTVLRSPVSGVVTARNYDSGDMYIMGSPIYTVQQITPVKLLVAISESDYSKVRKGDVVSIEAEALPSKVFEGRVNRIYPTIDPATHTFTAEVVVANGDRQLRPGMFARVTVTFGVNNSIVLPDSAIVKQQGSGQKAVFVVKDDNSVEYRVVTLGRHFGTNFEILEGLEEGERIVVKGTTGLHDGSKVKFE